MLSPNGVTTILFDLDGTLRHNRPDGAEVFIDQAVALGLAVSLDDRRRGIRWEHYYWASSPELRADFKKYEGHSSDFWLNYGRRQLIALGAEKERAKELGAMLAQFMDEQYKPESIVAEQAAGMLDELKKAGFKLGVVSNRDNPFFEELDQLKLIPYFDLLLAAGEVQSYKPEPGIFEAALERLGMRAGQAMYVGDNYFADVVGARNAGLRPVLYDPRGVYPDAGCEVIQSFDQLLGLLR
jgi:HAD superfamily hydrolase (TIGR01549 family)